MKHGRQWLGWRCIAPIAALCAVFFATDPTLGQDIRYLRLGTGPPGENLFPLGGLIAGAISNPPGSRPCDRGGNCGVPGLIAVASATSGSVTNLQAVGTGRMDAALVQADVALWATAGALPFQGHPILNLRAVANLTSVQIHLVARAGINIKTLRDLKGRRVSLGEKGSGTLVHSRQLLAALGLKETDVKAQYLRSALAADAMQTGSLDAFFAIDGAPMPSVVELARALPITLVPIAGDLADRLKRENALLSSATIEGGTYDGVTNDVSTLQVGVSLVVAAELSDNLVYGITKALWQPGTVQLLTENQPQTLAKLDTATLGLGVPLHPGAARYYAEAGAAK